MRRSWVLPAATLAAFLLALGSPAARAPTASLSQQTISVGGVRSALLTPKHPRGAIILLTGGNGYIGVGEGGAISNEGNQLVRTRDAYAARGFAVLVPDCCVDVAAAVDAMRRYGKVTLVGTSRGTLRAAQGIAAGARPDRLVLTSGFLSDDSGSSENAMRILGTPDALPPTLVVHHRQDACHNTMPQGVKPFRAWAHGKARAVWLDGGQSEGDACEAFAYHGFNGIDGAVVSAVAGFAAR